MIDPGYSYREFDRYRDNSPVHSLRPYTYDGKVFEFEPEKKAEEKPKSCLNSASEYAVRAYGQEIGGEVNKEVSRVISYVMFNNYRESEIPTPNIHPPAPDYSKPFVKEELAMVQAAWDRFSDDQRAGLRMFALGGATSSESLSPLARFNLRFVDEFAEFEKKRRH